MGYMQVENSTRVNVRGKSLKVTSHFIKTHNISCHFFAPE